MPRNPLVLIHGYSDHGKSFDRWKGLLEAKGFDVSKVGTANYRTLTNEITIKDLAEGLDRALKARGIGEEEPFDALVHSTGMLVIRAWITAYPARLARVRRIVGLAPATYGSPLAHKGRGWLGAIFKGNKEPGPDFMEAGDRVLDGLELASAFTWDLAHRDLVGENRLYTAAATTPYVFVFCGTQGYSGVRRFVSPPASDGTVRWAGCSMDTRKVVVDLTMEGVGKRVRWLPEGRPFDAPVNFVEGVDHTTILRDPPKALVERVAAALEVDSAATLRDWQRKGEVEQKRVRTGLPRWQQFVIRLVDERGDPVPDYNIELVSGKGKSETDFEMQVHPYGADSSLRCFHVDLDRLNPEGLESLTMKVVAPSGSALITYLGVGSDRRLPDGRVRRTGVVDASVDMASLLRAGGFSLFYPFTTTLVEIRLNREPLPLKGMPDVFRLM
jgi:hypothetical protein